MFHFRFRIRTLLLLILIAAVTTLVLSNRRLWWLTPTDAAAEIRRLGGDTEAGDKIVLAGFFGPIFKNEKFYLFEPLVDLRMLSINRSSASDIAFANCIHLVNIEYIQLEACSFDGDFFRYLKNNTRLKTVVITDTPISDLGLNLVAQFSNLQTLIVDFLDTPSTITEIDVAAISKLSQLKQLHVTMDRIPAGLEAELKLALPQCDVQLFEQN